MFRGNKINLYKEKEMKEKGFDPEKWVLCEKCDVLYRKSLEDGYKTKEKADYEEALETKEVSQIVSLVKSGCPMCTGVEIISRLNNLNSTRTATSRFYPGTRVRKRKSKHPRNGIK